MGQSKVVHNYSAHYVSIRLMQERGVSENTHSLNTRSEFLYCTNIRLVAAHCLNIMGDHNLN